ncbi:MAG: hypothetical protein OES32_06880 [Acidobacteriota bacterium]|nr:hypothetical protein [Acidobacteriota bacterium]MDH3523295.1 hypothetical protein [Acidobacteriota bacterium]
MSRQIALAFGCWLLFAGAAISQLYPPVEAFTPAGSEETSIALLPAGTPGGASELAYASHCLDTSPRQGLVALEWSPGERLGTARRIDVTKLHEGFATGRFDATRKLAADVRAVSLQDPEPGIYYYWRVLEETPAGWISSPVARFEAPVCPSDGPVFDRSETEE